MAEFILGYRVDPAFRSFFSFVFRRTRGSDWRIDWASENVDMQGNGVMRFGQIKRANVSKGLNICLLLQRGINALKIARKTGGHRHTVLFATATAEQLEKLPGIDRDHDKGHVLIKDGYVPLLGEYSNAVLVWGNGWTGTGSEARLALLFDEIVRTFIFPGTEEDVSTDSALPAIERRDGIDGLEGCG